MDTAHRKAVIWRTDILPAASRRALEYFAQASWLRRSDWYLAGGTALALQVGHRVSVDLDFFIPKSRFSPAQLLAHFKAPMWEADILREGTVYGRILGAKVSFIAYPFFAPHESYQWYGNIRVLDPRDIAVMKIIAVSQRGRKRDFLNLYWYCTNHESLKEVLRRVPKQYPTVTHDYHHLLKALVYFEDADNDKMPRLCFRVSWRTIKDFFKREVRNIAKDLL